MLTIKECDVLAFWSQPIQKFLLHFGFKPIPNLKSQDTLGSLFEKTLIKDYPMFDRSKKLTTQRIINLIKSYQLFGLVVISGQAGNESKQILKDFLPFSSTFFLDFMQLRLLLGYFFYINMECCTEILN